MAKLCKREDYTRPKPDMTPPPGGVWYAVVANVNCEHKAELGLSAVCHTYLPMKAEMKKVGGRRKVNMISSTPLFPRYVFVASRKPGMFPFYALRGVRGVESIVRTAPAKDQPLTWRTGEAADDIATPLAIPHRVMAEIMQREIDGKFEFIPRKKVSLEECGLEEDEVVRIKAGAFEGFEAVVKKLMRGTHARVFLSVFGRATQTEIPVDELEKVA